MTVESSNERRSVSGERTIEAAKHAEFAHKRHTEMNKKRNAIICDLDGTIHRTRVLCFILS